MNKKNLKDKEEETKKSKDKVKKAGKEDNSDNDTLSVLVLSTGVPFSTSYNNLSINPDSLLAGVCRRIGIESLLACVGNEGLY